MLKSDTLANNITILVNSCDSYADLWTPFFTLLKRYWNPQGIDIILNTESLNFELDGLDIKCIHPENINFPYGKRIINALSYVKTKYIVLMLDDFFLRKQVDTKRIAKILDYMENDSSIVYFNCDYTPVYYDWEVDKYPGFKRIPPGNDYTLNMQAAIWRTEELIKYWQNDVSPWEWETVCNFAAADSKKYKFYCSTDYNSGFCDYGHDKPYSFGVIKGKWNLEDVLPLFAKENIDIDFSLRGKYKKEKYKEEKLDIKQCFKRAFVSDIINRCLPQYRFSYFVMGFAYIIILFRNLVLKKGLVSPEKSFIYYKTQRIKNKFLKKQRGI